MNIKELRRSFLLGVFVIAAVSIAACTSATTEPVKTPASPTPAPISTSSPVSSPAGSPSASPVAGNAKAESLVGRWSGPEGTFLNVTKKGEKYSVEVSSLDGPKTYEGTSKGDVIEFTRNGKTESLRAATGPDTGMKGFEKETNCVVITKGSEGYCKK
jgi:hypothetical protein